MPGERRRVYPVRPAPNSCHSGQMIGKFVYWLAVLLISLALLVGLVLFLESRDNSTLAGARAGSIARTA